jgi:MFS family permease
VATGIAGTLIAPIAMLWVVALLSLASIAMVYRVDARAIDHTVARGGDDGEPGHQPVRLRALLREPALLVFTAAITLFHFANAAMLPLLGEKLASDHHATSSLFMAACIILAQVVMVPMALLVGRKADDWGRKPLFLAAFAVLPVRGVLYTLTENPYALVSIQALDGIAAGIFGALFFVVIADLTEGTGHHNLALGASGACWGLGAALSNGVAGMIAATAGYSFAFLALSACALAALVLFLCCMPETRGWSQRAARAGRGAKPVATSAT